MSQVVKGVIARSKGAPVETVNITIPDPGPGEAVVKIETCGVCHTDLHYREGGINDEFPFLLGHEAAGIVEAVGDDVTEVAPGDFVILNWRAVCGECRACKRGDLHYCFATHNATQKMTLADGTELDADLVIVGIGSRPALDFLEGSGIAVDNGIVCDNVGRTSAEHVWALGDVASWRDATGHQARVEHWSNVAEQARVLVPSMFGQDAPESVVVPYFWSDQYDVKTRTLGTRWSLDRVTMAEEDGQALCVLTTETAG